VPQTADLAPLLRLGTKSQEEIEEEEGIISLDFKERQRLYDLGVVKKQPTRTDRREEMMRAEVVQFAYIQKGTFPSLSPSVFFSVPL
jgi:hypothetical protein